MRSLFTASVVVCAFCTLALKAELVILGGGDLLKVEDYEVQDDRILLELAAGGRMTLPLSRVSHIVDDEIGGEEPVATPGFKIGFEESQPVPDAPYGSLIHATARRHSLNPDLVTAMIRQESAFDAGAISPRGARGLMQLMPDTALRFGVAADDLHDPEKNLEAGVRYLSWLTRRFDGDLDRVLAAFNAGEGTVDRYQGVPPYRETREYVRRINAALGVSPSDV
jgi:hypothetical protein